MRPLLFGICLAAGVAAQAAQWTSHGPTDGYVKSIAAAHSNQRIVYVANLAGVFRSDDRGLTWRNVTNGIGAVDMLAIDPVDADTVYAAAGRRLMKTTDGGRHWRELLSYPRPTAILIDPANRETVYIGSTCGPYYPEAIDFSGGIFKSSNGGTTWKLAMNGFKGWPEICVNQLALDPASPDHLFSDAKFADAKQWWTFDGAARWDTTADPIPVRAVVPHPLYPLTRYGLTPTAILVSSDGGLTWRPTAGHGLPSGGLASMTIDPNTGRLFLGTSGGVFRSGDGGENWIPLAGGPREMITGVDFDPLDQSLIVGSSTGVFRIFSPTFAQWEQLTVGDRSTWVERLVTDWNEPATVYAATVDYYDGSGRHGRLFRSGDAGATWELIPGYPGGHDLIAVDGRHNLYAASFKDTIFKRFATTGGWIELHPPATLIQDVVTAPQLDETVYVVGLVSSARSRNGGLTWEPMTGIRGARSLAVDPNQPNTLYAGTPDGVMKSIDGGESWSALTTPPRSASLTVVAPSDSSTIYQIVNDMSDLSGPYRSLLRSRDGGRTWFKRELPATDTLLTLAVDPHDAAMLWLGSDSHGLFRSTNGGNGWTSANDGLPTLSLRTLAIDRNGTVLHAGTASAGVWELPLTVRVRALRPH